MLYSIVAVLGMIAVGVLTWRLLERQGHASPPTDDEGGDDEGSVDEGSIDEG